MEQIVYILRRCACRYTPTVRIVRMLDPDALVAKFGDWSRPYADAVIPALHQYGKEHTQVSLRRGANDEEAILTIKTSTRANDAKFNDSTKNSMIPTCMLDTAKVNEIRSDHDAFKRQCIEVVVWPKMRLIEYTFADIDKSISAQIKARHCCCTWHPDSHLRDVVTPACDGDMHINERLHQTDVKRIRHIVSLYLLSSTEVPAFRVYIEDEGALLVFVGVRRMSLSWCMHLIRQADIGVERVQVTDNEIRFTMSQCFDDTTAPVSGPIRTCARARRASDKHAHENSIIGRIRRGLSYIL